MKLLTNEIAFKLLIRILTKLHTFIHILTQLTNQKGGELCQKYFQPTTFLAPVQGLEFLASVCLSLFCSHSQFAFMLFE